MDDLKDYRKKRDFNKSAEPEGTGSKKSSTSPGFVIQKHAASSLHYDFRLEIKGVLKSWAVPKGLSTDPSEKRLAIQTEDHPLAYADFEGIIPQEEYGGGTVIVWDGGTFRNLRREKDDDGLSMAESFKDGKIEVWLEGRKLKGGYVLIHARPGGSDKNWLIKKMKDNAADARRKPVNSEPESILSNKTIEEINDEMSDKDKDE